ncbi:uncharacterized protein F5Z01DRAFT_26941 [Emericellopsis atlantica]|uniref:Uncharacterized protein n=1 Tax=Emericellopsis atlantica TaxID=2614577 RepID=A0A9P8CTT8_9HYPO|nr:uncharacterized protein F5Z01DRAFT_26941 [Emericellopsis atlantica]KAG9259138.1 hypothetical protein F5Z01DRAFT_26941 [Emericellopsis atlantica]
MAEEPSPYVPSMEACQIDFTPEPQSPCRSSEARFRDRLEIGQIDSDIASSASLTASPSLPVFHPDRGVNPRDLMLDEPIVEKELNGSSVAKVEAYPSKDLPVLELCEEDVVMDDQPADGYFDEAFAAILEDRHSACMRTVEQERFDPVDSIARIRVPPLEFTIPPPLWEQHTQGSRQMFEWVLNDAAWLQSAHFRPMPKDFDSMLKWAPFAPTAGRVSTTGSVDIPEDVLGQLLETKPPLVSSRSHVRQGCALRVAHLGSEDDIEAPPESGPTKSAVGAPRVSPHFRTQQRSDSLKPEATSSKGLDDLVKAAASKRKASVLDCTAIDNQNLLPFSSDSKATSRLLSGFMELRGRQTSSRDSEHGPSVRTDRNTPREVGLPVPAVKSNNKSSKSPTPALAPEFTIPAKKRTYIFSLALPRAVLRHIGRVWPKEHLVDRDYSHRSTLAWSPGSARRKEVTLSPAHEADISLTPTTGLIVTTLLKAKQQSLPNAKALPQLRERVLEVSQKYESLIILVSEGNTAGEYANDLPSSDMEAYAEFVRFASVLQAGVTVQLVPGAEGTLAKWVLKFMCEHSPRDREVPMFIQTQETSWEIFFRRGGMNVLAAQVMAGVLHQRKGDQGLADFKDMSVEQRIAMYGSFLGGPKLLANFSNMLDQSWE